MLTFESMALINNQTPFVECEICDSVKNQSQSTKVESEQKSKYTDQPFKYNQLADVIKYYVGSYLDLLDLTRLASTHRATRDMLKCKNETISPYLIAKIQYVTLLTPESLYSYVRVSDALNGFDLPTFIKKASVLTHLIALDELKYKDICRSDPSKKKQQPLNEVQLNRILVSCATIRHLTIDFEYIIPFTLDNIAKACPNLQQLTLKGNIELPQQLMKVINQFKKLEYLAIKPTSWVASNQMMDTLVTHEISELIERGIHIKLLSEYQ